MEKKKKINWRFKKLEYKLMEEYLEEMAMKGWFPSEISGHKAIFIPTEKRKLKFYVNVNPHGDSWFHNGDNELLNDYKNSCEKLGWHFITSYDQMYFFYAEIYENTYHLQTDLELEQKLVINNVWKKELLKCIGLSIYFISIISFLFYISYFKKGYLDYKMLTDWVSLFNIFVFLPVVSIIYLVILIRNFIWYFNMKSNIGLKNNKKSLEFVKLRNKLYDIGSSILLGISILMLLSGFFPRGFIYEWTTKTLIIIIIIFSVISCIIYNIFKEKINKKGKIIFVSFIFIGISILVYLMAQLSLNEDGKNQNEILTVAGKYPIIKISDFVDIDTSNIDNDYNPLIPINHESYSNDFLIKYSPLVPISYKYYEYYDNSYGNVHYTAKTEYYKCINESIASIIYEGIINEYENINYFKLEIKTAPAETWNCDQATIVSGDMSRLLLLKDNEVINVYISENLVNVNDKEFKEKIHEKFTKDN